MREGVRVRATELQGDRMFGNVKPQVACAIAVQDCAGRDHFRIQTRMPGDLPQEEAAMPIGPIQHRSEEHTSELQSLMRISYDVFCLNKKRTTRQRLRQPPDTRPPRSDTRARRT